MPDKHRMKLESKSESYSDVNYLPILITICILLVVIFLIYKLFTKVSILTTAIADVNIKLEKINA